jgi:hypothetical protein
MRATECQRLLSAPVAHLLASGGDTRLYLDPITRLKGYGCRPSRDRRRSLLHRRRRPPSPRGYVAAEAAREALIRGVADEGIESAYKARVEELRREVSVILGLEGVGAEIVFSPSGTDSALHAIFPRAHASPRTGGEHRCCSGRDRQRD